MSKGALNKIIAKLDRLDEYLTVLSEVQKVNRKSFINDYHFYALAERYLQLAIEVILDIGKLLIIAADLRKPEENQEIFDILAEKKLIPRQLVTDLSGIVGFRNILVHDYEKIDRVMVYEKLQKNLDHFKRFKRAIVLALRRKPV